MEKSVCLSSFGRRYHGFFCRCFFFVSHLLYIQITNPEQRRITNPAEI